MKRIAPRPLAAASIAACLGIAIAAAPASPTPAPAVTPAVITAPGSIYFGFLPPVLVVEKGGTLTYSNFDAAEHDFVQDVESDGFGGPAKAPWCKKGAAEEEEGHHNHGCPIFWTPLLGMGESATVKGLKKVKSGATYSFFCTKHHNMQGTLIVR